MPYWYCSFHCSYPIFLGSLTITWSGYDGNDYETYWIKVNSAGTPETPLKISTHLDNLMGNEFEPQIAVSSGISYITWTGYNEPNWEIYWLKETQQARQELFKRYQCILTCSKWNI
jgi:hypothetical protein